MKDINEFSADTLVGDIRDAMLGRIQRQAKPWPALSEAEQRSVIEGVTAAAETMVRQAVRVIAARGFGFCPITLKEMKVKDSIEVKFAVTNVSSYREMLGDNIGDTVLIVLANPDDFAGGGEVKPDPDEPDLPMLEHRLD